MAARLASLTAVSVFAAATPAAWAASDFPRGPGFYFNLWSVALVLVVYFLWIYTVAWVDQDAKRYGLDRQRWSAIMLGSGLLGLLLLWAVPPFLISFFLLLACVFGPYVYYVMVRNPLAPKSKRLWTERHWKKIVQRTLRIKFDLEPDEVPPPAGPDIKYLKKPTEPEHEESGRIRKAKQHRSAGDAATLLVDAIERHAQHLYLEPAAKEWTVKLDIDGVIHSGGEVPRSAGEGVIQVFKMLAELDLSEKRKPQEGNWGVEVDGIRYDAHVHTAGSVAGEKLTLRLQERNRKFRLLPELGISVAAEPAVAAALKADNGLLVVCGPPRSGVTATAHSLLVNCDRFQRNVFAIEDPIETRLPNIDQVALDRRAGETYAAVLRKVLVRHEPNIIFVGELTDRATAEVVNQTASEKYLMLTTVEAPDAVTGLFRLIELGIPGPKLAKTLHGVLAPRLFRVLCPDCKVKYKPNPEMVRKANLPVDRVKFLCRPPEKGELPRDEEGQIITCEKCHGIGYFGRTAVFEYLALTEPIRRLLKENASLSVIKQEAIRGGMAFLQDEAMQLAVDGITSIPEILRVLSGGGRS